MTNYKRTKRSYTKEEKDKLISRMLPPENISTRKLSVETGISQSTLSTWKRKAIASSNHNIKTKRTISSREKFLIVMETYTLSEVELAKYCRENGLYLSDIKEWRSSCIAANDGVKVKNGMLTSELKEEKKKTRELKKDLRRKEKALAETAALLVLRKKLDAIFEENEED